MSGCTKCGGKVGARNTSGYCCKCWPKVSWKITSERDPDFEKRRTDGIRRKYASDPEFKARAADICRRNAALPQAREARSKSAKEHRIWERGNAAQPAGSPSRRKAGARTTATKLAWCPPELRDEYRRLRRAKFTIAEAKEMVLQQHEANMARFRRNFPAKALSEPRPQPIDYKPSDLPPNSAVEAIQAEKRRIDSLRVSRAPCPQCGVRTDHGCECRRAA